MVQWCSDWKDVAYPREGLSLLHIPPLSLCPLVVRRPARLNALISFFSTKVYSLEAFPLPLTFLPLVLVTVLRRLHCCFLSTLPSKQRIDPTRSLPLYSNIHLPLARSPNLRGQEADFSMPLRRRVACLRRPFQTFLYPP